MRAFLFGALTFAIVFAGTCFMGVVVRGQSSLSPHEEAAPLLDDREVGSMEQNAIQGAVRATHFTDEELAPQAGCFLGASPFVIRD